MTTEQEALLAMLRGDDETAERLIRSLKAEERAMLRHALYRLDMMNTRVRQALDDPLS